MKTNAVKLLPLLLAFSLLAGCGAQQENFPTERESAPPEIETAAGGTELVAPPAVDNVFTLNFDPEAGVNPIKPKSATNLQIASLLYDSVFELDEDFSVSSKVITEYQTSDYSWWQFTVNPDLRFSDGTPMTAQDIVYSIRVAQQSSYYSSHLRCIFGISTTGTNTFAVTANGANCMLPAMLNIPIIKSGEYYEDYPIGSGPYVLDEDHGALRLNGENPHAREMPLDIIYLRDFSDPTARIAAFEEGRLDLVTNDPAGIYNLGYGSVKETRYYSTTNLHYLGFNMRGNYFQDYHIRAAVGYLADRDYLVNNLMHGAGDAAVLPCHPMSELYDLDYASRYRYDPAAAMELFTRGGVEDLDDDGVPEILVTGIVVELNLKFIVNTDSAVKVMAARRITDELNALGITTTLYELSWDEYMNALGSGDFDIYYGEIRMGADWNLRNLFAVPNEASRKEGLWGMNYAHNVDTTYEELYSAYLKADDTERYAAFQEAAQYVVEQGFIIPLCFERRELLTQRGAVTGPHPTQYDLFNRFSEWTITLEQDGGETGANQEEER